MVWGDTALRLKEAGITILSGMLETVGEDYSTIESIGRTGGVRPSATWPATRDRAIKVAAVARTLGIRLVTFHAGFLPHDSADPERMTMLQRLREVAQMFAAWGISIAFETGQEPAETLASCLDQLAMPSVGVNFDPANMLLYGAGDPVEALRYLLPWVRQVHVKDAVPSGVLGTWGQEVVVGKGSVDWSGFLAELSRCPFRPNLILEREAGEDRLSDVVAARLFVEQSGVLRGA